MERSQPVTLTWSSPARHVDLKEKREGGPAGIYLVIAGKRISGRWNEGTFKLLDVGQAADVYLRVAKHDREACWHAHARGSSLLVKVAELPMDDYDESDRRALVCCIRASERPPCGSECNEGYHRDESVEIANQGKPLPLKPDYAC